MDMVLRSFNVVQDGKEIAHFELFKRGYTREVRTRTSVIYTGFDAAKEYDECLETNRSLCSMLGGKIVIEK